MNDVGEQFYIYIRSSFGEPEKTALYDYIWKNYRRRVAFYTKDRAFDVGKMRRVLGYSCRHSNESGLTQTARWYVEHGWLRRPSATR